MTQLKFAVIDIHNRKTGKSYNIIYTTNDINRFNEYISRKIK